MKERRNFEYRSVFWPILLISIGVIWLLANLEILPDVNFASLLRLWPLVLIAVGLDLLFGRRSQLISAVIGVGTVGLAIAILLLAPSLGIETSPDLKTLSFSEPLENVESARIDLDLSRYPTTVDSRVGSNLLFEAELDTHSDVIFSARGDENKTLSIDPVSETGFNFGFLDLVGQNARWDIHIDPNTPLELNVDVGSGSVELNLADLVLTDLHISGGSGSVEATLPDSSETYRANIDGGSGSFRIEVAEGASLEAQMDVGSGSFDVTLGSAVDFEAEVEGGSGSFTARIASGLGVRIIVRDRGSGGVNLPSRYVLMDDMGDNDRDTGIWETEGFDGASHKVEFTFDPGSGSFNIR
jgi:hypothetical protein